MVDDVADLHRAHVPLELAGLDLREIQHVVDELREPFPFAHDDREVLLDLADRLADARVVRGDLGEEAVLEPLLDDLREAEHRGERRTQFVADRGEERALGRVGLDGGFTRAFRLLEQPPDLVFLFVQLAIRGGVVERDRRVRGQAAQDVEVVLRVGVRAEGLDRDDAEHPVLREQRQVDDRLRRL